MQTGISETMVAIAGPSIENQLANIFYPFSQNIVYIYEQGLDEKK